VFKGIQVVGVLVGLYLAGLGVAGFVGGGYGWRRAGFWVVFGSTVSVLFLDPALASFALPFFTTQDTITTVLTVGILISFFLIARLQRQIVDRDRRLAKLVQSLALRDYLTSFEGGEHNSSTPNEDRE